MRNSKKYLVLSLAACMTLSPLVVKADNDIEKKEIIPISAPINKVDQIEEEVMSEYVKFEGKITEINHNDNRFSIKVMSDETDPYNGKVFHINENVILLNDKTKDFLSQDTLKKGDTVTGYYDKNTIMTLSLPPQITPNVIVVNENEGPLSIKVDKFNKELVSSDNQLKINPSEDTIIVDKDGNKMEKEDILDRDLIVFYTISTRSIPAQTTPEKIIVMDKEDEVVDKFEIKILDKMIIEEKEITLDKFIYKNEKGVVMIPLRQIAETLEYKVTWNNEARAAELTKGAQWTSVKIGEDNYNFAKMLVKLGTAPEVKDSTTYVPFDFLNEVLKVNVEITEAGMIEIIK